MMIRRHLGSLLRPLTHSGLALLVVGCSASSGAGDSGAVTPQPPPAAATPAAPTEPAPAASGVNLDTVRAGRFDNGKMWTFEYPPLDYFQESYGFAPDSAWFERARLGALRLPNCSASFVSPNGLVMTNHHCAREGVTEVARAGETLLDDGFYARSLEDERVWEETYVDQLIKIIDVSDEVLPVAADARQATLDRISERIAGEYGGEEAGIVVEMIALWNGARYSAYVFRRYDDVRVVFAPELNLGKFGGDPDNFTYPRYTLDMSFLRVYDESGDPLKSDNFFRWSERGVEQGDAVLIIGNPGTTNRLQTVAQLEYRRDFGERAVYLLFQTRAKALRAYYAENPQEGDSIDVRNDIALLANFDKFYGGVWQGLQDPVLMARRRDSEREFRAAIESDSALNAEFAGLFDRMAETQSEKAEFAADYGAFVALGSATFTSAILLRGFHAFQYVAGRDRGAPAEALEPLRDQLLGVEDQPNGLQARMLAARLRDFQKYLEDDSDIVREILQGRDAETAAKEIVDGSVLAQSTSAAQAVEDGSLTMDDPALQLVAAFIARVGAYQAGFTSLLGEEGEIAAELGRARFEVYGTSIPPDATFSLRIADGVVTSYEYNGTEAPVYTTYYGLYDHYYSYRGRTDWDLPERWLNPPASFDLSTPLNFVMTADIIGGNSGSPVLNLDLEVVGLVFDGNIESLPGDFIYVPTSNRSVAVDARGILEALRAMYDADRLVLELTTGRLATTDAEADAALVGN